MRIYDDDDDENEYIHKQVYIRIMMTMATM